MVLPEIGALLPIGDVDIVPSMREVRASSTVKPGSILVTPEGAYLCALTEKGERINVDLRSGIAPRDTTVLVVIPVWSLVSRSNGGTERLLFSMTE